MTGHKELEAIYSQRFAGQEGPRNEVWRVLTQYCFQRWIQPTHTVLDLGAGYCEFINNIKAARKLALDLNPVTQVKAAAGVEVVSHDITKNWPLPDSSVDVVFTSNFFEHLPRKEDLTHCLSEIYRVLRPAGRLVAMGPNIRFCYDIYWDFLDHHLPLSDRSIVEATEVAGFITETVIPRFLPFTMRGKLPPRGSLVRLYLSFPMAWKMLGKQFLVVVRKA